MEPLRESDPGADARPTPWTLGALREQIDQADAELVAALVRRYRLAEKVGALKGREGIPAMDPAREAEIVRAAGAAARSAGIPDEGVREIFWSVVGYCREGVRRRALESPDEPASSTLSADG